RLKVQFISRRSKHKQNWPKAVWRHPRPPPALPVQAWGVRAHAMMSPDTNGLPWSQKLGCSAKYCGAESSDHAEGGLVEVEDCPFLLPFRLIFLAQAHDGPHGLRVEALRLHLGVDVLDVFRDALLF